MQGVVVSAAAEEEKKKKNLFTLSLYVWTAGVG
jgi:hypothetical protein